MKTKIQKLLFSIHLLLLENEQQEWAKRIELFSKQLDVDYKKTLLEVKGIFAGAGSFNDLVLHKKGEMLKSENNELNMLQDKLYDVLKEEILKIKSQ